MRVLTFTSLYPNAVNPQHGVFVENRLVHLVRGGRVSSIVIAPVPWFPLKHPRFGRYSEFARIPREEQRHGIRVLHPRYLTIPVLGAVFAPLAMALGARATMARLQADGTRFQAIDAHYFFPDGVAAALLARWSGLPLVITARGSDLNTIADGPIAGRAILWAARVASGLITVSRSLRDRLIELGADPGRTVVLRNGVDATRFYPVDRDEARRRYEVARDAKVVLSVGRLHPGKGHDLVIEAVAGIPGAQLLIAGGGAERAALAARADALGVGDRVRFVGQVAHDELSALYSAADVLVLASSHEGWPNVLLEAMACGTPTIATRVGGTPEIVAAAEAGVLVQQRTAAALVAALRTLLADPPDRAATRRYAEQFSWDETSRGQERLFASLSTPAPEPAPSGIRQ